MTTTPAPSNRSKSPDRTPASIASSEPGAGKTSGSAGTEVSEDEPGPVDAADGSDTAEDPQTDQD